MIGSVSSLARVFRSLKLGIVGILMVMGLLRCCRWGAAAGWESILLLLLLLERWCIYASRMVTSEKQMRFN